jgi:hypothetical protein
LSSIFLGSNSFDVEVNVEVWNSLLVAPTYSCLLSMNSAVMWILACWQLSDESFWLFCAKEVEDTK